jgi:ABC-2 type transport system ATP-binding protein
MAMIEVDSLRKIFKGGRGLDSFSLRLEGNELVGLVGPNGAGKTTLIKILSTLLQPDSGLARLAGHDVRSDPLGVRSAAGYLPDVPGIYQDLRIREFLEFFADAYRLKEPNRSASIERALNRSGLADRPDDFVEHLSLGWKQRLLLAKTLLHNPKVLLLDEPATGLDPLARIALREQLKQLHAEGVTILISSHILSDLEDICTRIVFIANGKNVSEPPVRAASAGAAAATIRCEIEFASAADAVDRTVTATSGAQIVEKRERGLVVDLPGGNKEAAAFLQSLLATGVLITHFDARGPGLEERYRRAFGGQTS